MDSFAYQDAIHHPYADMKKSSDELFAVFDCYDFLFYVMCFVM